MRVFALLCLLGAGLAFGGTITVTQPAGGSVNMGALLPIAWTASGVSVNVKIQLIRPGGALVGLLMTNVAASPQSWTVAAPALAGEQYRIRVRAVDGSAQGESAVFTVTGGAPASGLSLVAPHGGESWTLGSTQAISWIATNIQENCRLLLLKDGQVLGTIRESFAPGEGAGSWNWKVGDYLGGTAPMAGGYKVRMELVSGFFNAQSAAPFTIAPLDLVVFPPARIEAKAFVFLRPDLAVCLSWDGKRPYIWEDKRITVRVKNIGSGEAPASTCSLYVEGNGTRSFPVPVLAGNAEFTWSDKFDWPTIGEKTVRATVDTQEQVTESNENNNQISKVLKVILPHQDRYVVVSEACSDSQQP